MLHHVTRGTGRPLVVLHGSRLDHRHMMAALEPVFTENDGWRRLYPDLPGHGQSPPDPAIASQDDLLAAVMEGLDRLLPDQPFALIGESCGSTLAAGIAQHWPDRVTGLALVVPGGSPSGDPARLPAHQIIEPAPHLRDGLAPEERPRFDGFMVVQRQDIIDKTRETKLPALALADAAQEERIARAFDLSFDRDGT